MFIFVAQEVESVGMASSFGCNKVYRIAANVEDHVACTIECDSARIAGTVVEEVFDCLHCFWVPKWIWVAK